MKIIEAYGLKPAIGDFGIEIEVEGQNLPKEVNQYWKCEVDPSLRGESMEYIFAKPQALDKVKAIIKTLDKKFKDTGSVLNFSFRTSVHVHMNVQELSPERVLSTIYTYLLVEDALMNLCGENRKGNRFCLRMQDAEGLVERLAIAFGDTKGGFAYIPKDTVRYSAVNVESIPKYGSLEFRAMSGNCDPERIYNWCSILNCLKQFTEKYSTPMDVYDLYNKIGPDAFVLELFKDKYPLVKYSDMRRDVQKNYSLSIDLPFSFKKLQSKIKKPTIDDILRAADPNIVRQDWGFVAPLEAARIERMQAVMRKPPVGRRAAQVVMDDVVERVVEREEE